MPERLGGIFLALWPFFIGFCVVSSSVGLFQFSQYHLHNVHLCPDYSQVYKKCYTLPLYFI